MNDEELKAILIIDMPDNCYQCSCLQAEISYGTIDKHICGADYHKITELYKRNNCPLKPIPYKRTNYVMYENATFVSAEEQIAYLCGYEDGWNDCIDEILGEEE